VNRLTCQAAVHAASDQLTGLLSDAEGGPAEALAAQLPRLYALANAIDANAADDLVQGTLTSALVANAEGQSR
jgi:hypothetical protein